MTPTQNYAQNTNKISPQTHISTMAAVVVPWPPWCRPACVNALPLACAELRVHSTQVGFVMALVGVHVKELLDDVGYWWRTSVPHACQWAASVKKHNHASTTTVVQVLF